MIASRSGQQTAEFVVLMGIAAIAAIAMQFVAREAIGGGLRKVSDAVLGAPPPCVDVDGDGRCECDDLDRSGTCSASELEQELRVVSTHAVDVEGTADFGRVTRTAQSIEGHSVNEDVRLRTLPGFESLQ